MTDILIKDVPPALYRAIKEEKQRTGSKLSPLCRTYLDSVPDNPPVREVDTAGADTAGAGTAAAGNSPARPLRVRNVPQETKTRLAKIAKNHGLLKNEVYLRALERGVTAD